MGGKTQKKPWKNRHGVLTLFLVLVLVFTMIPLQQATVIRAEEDEPQPDLVISLNWNNSEGIEGVTIADGIVTFESLTVEPDHFVIIEGAKVHVKVLTLGEGARIEVLNYPMESEPTDIGTLSWDNLVASNGARLLLQSKDNIPSGCAMYTSDGNAYSEDDLNAIDCNEFSYSESEGKWVFVPNTYDEFGPTEDTIVVEVEICDFPDLSDVNFPFILPDGITEENSISDGNRVKFRVPNTTESVDLGWSQDGRPKQIAIDNNTGEEQNNWIIIEDDASMEGGKYTLQLNLTDGESPRNYYFVQFKYGQEDEPSEGNEQLQWVSGLFERLNQEQGKAYHAYGNQVISESGVQVNDDNNTDTDDLRLGWAKYLAGDFTIHQGRYQGIGEAIGLEENSDTAAEIRNIEKVMSMISCAAQPDENKILAEDFAGNTHELSAYTLTFTPVFAANMFTEEELQELQGITVDITAYMIETGDVSSGATYQQVVIKVDSEFYIRNAWESGTAGEFECLGSNDNNDNTRALNIVTGQLNGSDSVVVFGNNASLTAEKLSDDSAKTYFVNNFWMNENGMEMGGKVAIYRPDFTGVFLKPDTESNKQALAWETNTSYDIKESGEEVETDFYFGYGKAIISPLTGTKLDGIQVKELTNVEVLGDIPDNAVRVEKNADDTFTLEFLSDYYDQVEIRLTYLMNDETYKQNTLTINRLGIVLQYGRTPGDDKTRVQIHHGHDSGEFITDNGNEMGGVIYATYYHPQGTGNIDSSDTSLYVTLHYSDGRTEQKIIKASFFKAEDGNNTAMSDYVIAIAPKEGNLQELLPIYVEAIAVENADTNGRFNGAKLGAGKGVHCDVDLQD